MVILIGTSHKYQRLASDESNSENSQFRAAIINICHKYKAKAIAEEMSREALESYGFNESVAEQLSTHLDLIHQYSDPTNIERYQLGIRQGSDIRAEHLTDGLSKEQIETEVKTQSIISDRIREQYWMKRILELNAWPIIFICGANHVSSFSKLAKEVKLDVVVAYSDWLPERV